MRMTMAEERLGEYDTVAMGMHDVNIATCLEGSMTVSQYYFSTCVSGKLE